MSPTRNIQSRHGVAGCFFCRGIIFKWYVSHRKGMTVLNRFFLWLVVPIFLLSCYGTSQQKTDGNSYPMVNAYCAKRYGICIQIRLLIRVFLKARVGTMSEVLFCKVSGKSIRQPADEKYLTYIKKNIDQFVSEDGLIKTYEYLSFNLDNIATGRNLLALYKSTGDKKYKIAADTLRKQLANHPRTNEGGFWHKKIYPYQMWLDGIVYGRTILCRVCTDVP